MSVTRVLLDILIVLAAAKVAAEIAERVGIPAVVGEIVAGVAIGPSAIGLVHGDEVLRVLGEIGVILLLLDVGMEMDLGQLTAVGRAALSVATIGVVVPMAAGSGLALLLGMGGNEALFVGAALTATSVGITARVFGDLKALATVEARTVLGAAVADDVMGLVILTVVTRLVAQGSVSVNSVAGIVLVAVGFLAVATLAGVRLAPWLFAHVGRLSRSPGTLVALSLAFTLAFAELANAARLAPIVGAFVAGIALSRSDLAPRIRREITPVGHLFVPVFFLQIGIDAQVREFLRPEVLALAGALLVVAVLGKLAAAAGMIGAPGDRLVVGLAMIPRGEVGLIFATIGLSEAIIGRDVYAALLLVVLVTTLITPALLKARLRGRRRPAVDGAPDERQVPPGGWLHVSARSGRPTVELVAEPPSEEFLPVGLDAALAVGRGAAPGEHLAAWLSERALAGDPSPGGTPTPADPGGTAMRMRALLRADDARAWRFLLVTGVLEGALPELARVLRRRQANPMESDPGGALGWPRLAAVNRLLPAATGAAATGTAGTGEANDDDLLRLAALVLDADDHDAVAGGAPALARAVATRLALAPEQAREVVALVDAAALLPATARRVDGLDPEPVLQLASHLGTGDRARRAAVLAATGSLSTRESERVAQLADLVGVVLARPTLSGAAGGGLAADRRREAAALIAGTGARLDVTPQAFVLSQRADDLARQASLADPPLRRGEVRASVTPVGDGTWRLDAAVRDDVGLLAKQLEALRDERCRVLDVATVVWPDRQSLSTFRLHAASRPSSERFADAFAAAMPAPVTPLALPDAAVRFDDGGSPWHTVCTARADDDGLVLLALAKAVALCDVSVVAARMARGDDGPVQVLDLVTRRGAPVPPETQLRILDVLTTGRAPGLRRRRRAR